MSTTQNLKLFKHDEPLETNENDFDIGLALNENWDKIDEFSGKMNTSTDLIANMIPTLESEEAENINVEDKEKKDKIKDLATKYGKKEEDLKNNEALINYMEDSIKTEKVIKYILDNAKIK